MIQLRKANPVAAALAVGELDAEDVAAAVPPMAISPARERMTPFSRTFS